MVLLKNIFMLEINEQPAQENPQVDTPSEPQVDNAANPSIKEDAHTQNLNINRTQNKDAREEWQTGIEESKLESVKTDERNTAAATGNNETLGIP